MSNADISTLERSVHPEIDEEIKRINSNNGKHIRYTGSSHSKNTEGLKEVTSEDQRDRQFGNHLNKFYDEVIAAIRDADVLQILPNGL
jgi:hypothetical protein